jgi:hypothetical protein
MGEWTLYYTEEGYPYYYNSLKNESIWADLEQISHEKLSTENLINNLKHNTESTTNEDDDDDDDDDDDVEAFSYYLASARGQEELEIEKEKILSKLNLKLQKEKEKVYNINDKRELPINLYRINSDDETSSVSSQDTDFQEVICL